MVVASLLKWQSPAALILLVVMLGQSPCVVQPPALQNDFVEVFAGDAAVTLACWNMGLVGSCHDVRYTSLMDLSTTHGFLLLNCKVVFNAQLWNNRATWSVLFSILEYVLAYSVLGWSAGRSGTRSLAAYVSLGFAATALPRCALAELHGIYT